MVACQTVSRTVEGTVLGRSIQRWPRGRRRMAVRRQGITTGGRHWTIRQVPLHHVGLYDQHLQHIVEHISCPRTPVTKVRPCQQAQRLAVHLEEIKVEFGEIEFADAEPQEDKHILAAPEARIGRQGWGQLRLKLRQLAGRRWGTAPQHIAPDAGIQRVQ